MNCRNPCLGLSAPNPPWPWRSASITREIVGTSWAAHIRRPAHAPIVNEARSRISALKRAVFRSGAAVSGCHKTSTTDPRIRRFSDLNIYQDAVRCADIEVEED